MHEFGMCEPLVAAVTARAGGRRVTGVRVRVGNRHRVEPGAFEMAFALAAEGTEAEGAAVDLVDVPSRGRCDSCGTAGEWSDGLGLCPSCGSADVVITGGDELVLESITTAEPDTVGEPDRAR